MYLAMREIDADPADDFIFAVLRKPNSKGE
jgi:hypothetical protein